MARLDEVRRTVHRLIGSPDVSGRVPARLPLVLERHQMLTGSFYAPPVPAPLVFVHTGGRPMDYRTGGEAGKRQSLPGLVSFVPPFAGAEIVLHGVGEGTIVLFDAAAEWPAWLGRGRHTNPITFGNEVIVAVTRRLVREIQGSTASEVYLRSLGDALLAELENELAQPVATADPMAGRGGLRVAYVATQYMRAHLGEKLSVADLAHTCGVGVTSFSNRFRQATGATPHAYLRRARIERACELLRTTGLSVREVSEAVGFATQSHFCTVFASEHGLTPTAYRRAARAARVSRAGKSGNSAPAK